MLPSQHSLLALFLLPNIDAEALFRSSNQFTLPLLSTVKTDNLFHSSKKDQESKEPFTPLRLPVYLQLHTVDFFCPDQELQARFMQGTVWTSGIS